MTSFVQLLPLTGALTTGDRSGGPLAYILQIDEAKILLDCGWNDSLEDLDSTYFKSLASVAKQLDAVLLSHADMEHLGAYPYAVSKFQLSCPTYATYPVRELGQICVVEAIQAKKASIDYNTLTVEDVESAFDKLVQLRYSQPTPLSGKAKGITVTAYGAGHSLGGTFWKIKKDSDEIIYAVDYNHQKERHLSPTVLLQDTLLKPPPSLLITDSYNAFVNQDQKRADRDSLLFDTIRTAVFQQKGNVLIPIESATRCLELTYLLETYWASNQDMKKCHLIFLSRQSKAAISVAKRMLEWMGDGITALLTQERDIPFDFKFVKLHSKISDVEKTYSNAPKVVLAALSSMDLGQARELFLTWCNDERNTVVLPDRGPPGSLARKLYEECMNFKSAQQIRLSLSFSEHRRVPLAGSELEEHLRKEEEKRIQEMEEAEVARLAGFDDDDSDMSDAEAPTNAASSMVADSSSTLTTSGGLTGNVFDFYVKDLAGRRRADVVGFQRIQRFKMFPAVDYRRKVGDYGEQIDPLQFVNADARLAAAQAEQNDELPPLAQQEAVQADAEESIPSKYVTIPIRVDVLCKLIYIDFEGRSDGKSIKFVLSKIAPKKIILIHGSGEATNDLKHFCLDASNITNDIFCPAVNEWVNVSAATNIQQVRLTDSLVTSLAMAKYNNYELAYVSGVIRIPQTASEQEQSVEAMDVDGTAPANTSEAPAVVPVLDVLPVEYRRAHVPVIIGDLKLSEFRKVLLESGFKAEFTAGVLIVNDKIMVRKSQQGRIVLEGGLGQDYYSVRKLLYSQHAVLR